jgi:hypothetical protein
LQVFQQLNFIVGKIKVTQRLQPSLHQVLQTTNNAIIAQNQLLQMRQSWKIGQRSQSHVCN